MTTTTDQARPLLELGASSVIEHLGGSDTGGAIALLEFRAQPGYPVPLPHIHTHEDEITYVIEGALEITIGDTVRVVRAGESIFKPRGVAHAFALVGEEPVRFLETLTPAGFEGYFQALAQMVRETGEVDRDRALRLMAQYGLRST